ncbi:MULTISPECIES: DinB/UmuC family translesion DNA polymerase [Glutamicibacter]|uniref:DinB/UmuC family translesion DNA polymerase n=1 Tax=Glutamicibacter TaxID=1742989 RepID=UPI003F96A90C
MTSYYNQHQDHQPAITVKLPEPTVDPVVLTRAAKRLLPQILVGAKYARAGVSSHGSSTLGDAGNF